KVDDKCRALALSAAVGGHAAAVGLDDLLDDRQAQTKAVLMSRDRTVRLAEALEYRRQEFAGNTAPRIDHGDFYHFVTLLEPHMDRAALRRELDGVRQQIPDNLLETGAVRVDRRDGRQDFDVDTDPF